MANDQNLIRLSPSEARENGRKGGKASGEARRRKADFNKTLNLLLTTKVNNEELTPLLESLGIDSTLESAMLMSMIKAALAGDVKAANFVAQYSGQTDKSDQDLEEQKIRTDRAKKARDQEVGDADQSDENIQSFLKAMKPSQVDLEALFEDEDEEGINDGEETEETDDIQV